MNREEKPYYRKFSFCDFWLKYLPNGDFNIFDLDDLHDLVDS